MKQSRSELERSTELDCFANARKDGFVTTYLHLRNNSGLSGASRSMLVDNNYTVTSISGYREQVAVRRYF
ncbi:hypothetical protein [Legionella genomosp. 1]|uniref:hypothetical protein n=1 Tax=Legionella genomosp. 1 TaxID=1093625 RepID=UPI001054224E|nr:hypothetical protein [Legionella genomosp. 1]